LRRRDWKIRNLYIVFAVLLSMRMLAGADASKLAMGRVDSAAATGDIGSINKISILGNFGDSIPAVLYRNPGEVKIYWFAPGDDGYVGRASRYDIRYRPASNGPITNELSWSRATRAVGEPTPSLAGSVDSIVIGGLGYGALYYFCLRAYDEVGNRSPLSNSIILAAADTVAPPVNFVPGDANGDGVCHGSDVLYLVAYFHGRRLPPYPFLAGDANGDCSVNLADVTYLVRYFKGLGDPPVRGNCGPLYRFKISDRELSR